MIFFTNKKNNRTKQKGGPAQHYFSSRKNSAGFALLFSVLVSSLLLTIGLSIFNIALKELAISTNTQRSIHSFYAADSGRECAMYWDVKMGKIPSLFINSVTEGEIFCGPIGEQFFSGVYDTLLAKPQDASTVTVTIPKFNITTDNDGPNVTVSVSRVRAAPESDDCPAGSRAVCTSIVSTGYDSGSGDRVERAIEYTY